MQATYPRPDSDGSSSSVRNIGFGLVIAAAVVALLVAAYTVGYNRGKPNQQTAKSNQPPASTTGGPSKGGGAADQAAGLFKSTCGGCHVLKAAGTDGASGPNLDDLKPDAKTVEDQIAKGGGAMPANLLQGEEAKAVAEYVAKVAAKG